jgi:hypothetical protein
VRRFLLQLRQLGVGLRSARDHPPGPDDENVAEVDLRALGRETGFEVGEGDRGCGEGVEGGGGGRVGLGAGEPPGVVVY